MQCVHPSGLLVGVLGKTPATVLGALVIKEAMKRAVIWYVGILIASYTATMQIYKYKIA